MAWYRTGRASSVAGSNVITGVGTLWANNVFGIAPGQTLSIPGAGQVLQYEILAVDSDTKIRIATNVTTTITNSEYAIVTTVSNSMSDLARRTAVQLAIYQQLLEDWQNITTGTGDVTIIAPDGTEVVIPALSWISDSKTWFDTNKELIENAGEAVAGAGVARDQAVAANTAAQAAKTTAVNSAATASNAATTATGAASTATTAKNDAVAANTSAQAAKTAAEAAAASVNLGPLGIGLPTQTDIANFDWQNFVFTSGANYVTSYSTWINPPAGVTYDADTRVSIRVIYISTGSSRVGLEITPDTTSSTNFKVYKLLCVGAAGSRVFTFNQGWNSANAVPITGGGTGATTLVGAQSALGIVPQLITTLYPGGSAGSPPSIGINQRIDVANPFPGRNINFRVEILSGGIWGDPGFGSNIGSGSNSFGVVARDYNGAITIVSGVTTVGIYSNMIGNGFNSSASITTAQYRVIVWTIV